MEHKSVVRITSDQGRSLHQRHSAVSTRYLVRYRADFVCQDREGNGNVSKTVDGVYLRSPFSVDEYSPRPVVVEADD